MHKAKRSIVGIVTSLRAGQSGFVVQFQEWAGYLSFPQSFQPNPGIT